MIYLLEDDDSIRDFVIYTLNSQGMEARGFPLPSLFWQAVGEQMPALVLLDIMLPEEDGLSVLKKLRATPRTAKLPVIMLTAKGTEYFRFLKQQSCHKAHERTHDTTDANRDRVGDDLRSVVRCHNRKSKCFRNLSDNKKF